MHKDTNTQERGPVYFKFRNKVMFPKQSYNFFQTTFFLLKLKMELSSYIDNSLQESR